MTTENRNVANINALADFIESHTELGFDMAKPTVPHSCGTNGCIGGFSAALWPEIVKPHDGPVPSWNDDKLAEKLGISREDHDELCYGCGPLLYEEITRPVAVAALRRLAETGVIHFRREDDRP